METIIGGLVVIIGALAAAFGIGRAKGKSAAEADATAERNAECTAASEKRKEVLKNAIDVQQNVARQSDSDVDRQLHEKWRAGTGND